MSVVEQKDDESDDDCDLDCRFIALLSAVGQKFDSLTCRPSIIVVIVDKEHTVTSTSLLPTVTIRLARTGKRLSRERLTPVCDMSQSYQRQRKESNNNCNYNNKWLCIKPSAAADNLL